MNAFLISIQRPLRVRRLSVALTIVAIALTGCGGESNDGTNASSAAEAEPSPTEEATTEEIVIETQMSLTPEETIVSSGTVLDGSTVGDSPFCPGGTIEDRHGETPDIALVDRTITCSDGTLEIGFSPQIPEGNTQSGPWGIVGGTGTYEGWQGNGEMTMVYPPGSGANPTKGSETFTGTVTR